MSRILSRDTKPEIIVRSLLHRIITTKMIYLDYNATTPIAPEVLDAMIPYFTTEWGNPSISYKFGSKLKTVIETAREQVAVKSATHSDDIGRHRSEVTLAN